MSLNETIKELKEQLVEEDKKDAASEVPEKEESDEAAEKKIEEDKKEEEKPIIEEKPKEEEKKEESPDALAFQRVRREAAAAKKLADERETEISELRAKLAAPKEESVDQPAVDPEIQSMLQSHRMVQAEKEFMSLESKFASANPDYHAVSSEYALALAQSIKIQNPRLSSAEVAEETKKAIIVKSANFLNKGFDPIEELYNEAKELGFKGNSFKKEAKEEPKEEKEIKPDMKKLAENRAKSTGMTASSGESKGQLTKQAAADLSVAEWAKLPKSEKQRLLYG